MALASLAALFDLIEEQGEWPEELNLVMIVMLAKPDAYRPVPHRHPRLDAHSHQTH